MLHTEQQDDEEFQEADILWPDAAQVLELTQVSCSHTDPDDDDEHDEYSSELQPMRLQIGQKASSTIDIPKQNFGAAGARGAKAQAGFSKLCASRAGPYGSGSVIIGSHVFVPPHVIVDRRAKREKAMMMFVVPSGRAARAWKMRE